MGSSRNPSLPLSLSLSLIVVLVSLKKERKERKKRRGFDLRLEEEMEAGGEGGGGGDVPELSHFLIAVCFALGFLAARFLLDRLFFKVSFFIIIIITLILPFSSFQVSWISDRIPCKILILERDLPNPLQLTIGSGPTYNITDPFPLILCFPIYLLQSFSNNS